MLGFMSSSISCRGCDRNASGGNPVLEPRVIVRQRRDDGHEDNRSIGGRLFNIEHPDGGSLAGVSERPSLVTCHPGKVRTRYLGSQLVEAAAKVRRGPCQPDVRPRYDDAKPVCRGLKAARRSTKR